MKKNNTINVEWNDHNQYFSRQDFLLLLSTLLFKIPIFFTKHIQEDSFITWKVAKNLLNYGVIGFNGEERISASTTHLYVLISAAFQQVLGDSFIYPLLIFSSLLFGIGSIWLAKILFSEGRKKLYFVLFLNLTPPALTASGLGMEYGVLFFLYCGLLYWALYREEKWAYIILPILILWTRMDTVIFLGIAFLIDVFLRRKINFLFILGGLIGLISVIGFNYFYFGELVNHTILAKKIAYKGLKEPITFSHFLNQLSYYGGLLRMSGKLSIGLFLSFLVFVTFIIFKILKNPEETGKNKIFITGIVVFALIKIFIFIIFRAYFDWYYWLPRTFLFVIVFYFLLNEVKTLFPIKIAFGLVFSLSLFVLQILQSSAIGYMEDTQRMQIVRDLLKEKPNIHQSIILEPAGKIPFYTNLYTLDEVGLVNRQIMNEMQADENFWWINAVKKYQPKYILSIGVRADSGQSYYKMRHVDKIYFNERYQLVKEYPIADVYKNSPKILQEIYKIRPIGKDYYLYVKK